MLLCACTPAPQSAPTTVTPPPYGKPYTDLADWHLFADAPRQIPNDGVIPYEVNSPLFSDYATKFRFLFNPAGATIGYRDDGVWDLPVGAILVKTFSFRADVRDPQSPLKLLETRVLWHEPDHWSALTYVWNAAQGQALRAVAGPILPSDFIGPSGAPIHDDYAVPNTAQCKDCHSAPSNGYLSPIGIKARQLNRTRDYGEPIGEVSQIDRFAALGWFAAPPPSERPALADPFGSADLATRVRSYWDGNCAHCHEKGGYASSSALLLDFGSTDPTSNPPANWGSCKAPTSAPETCGDTFDVVPAQPDQSIMVCRVAATDPKYRMPLLGGNLVHAEGLALIRAWIASLPPQTCMP